MKTTILTVGLAVAVMAALAQEQVIPRGSGGGSSGTQAINGANITAGTLGTNALTASAYEALAGGGTADGVGVVVAGTNIVVETNGNVYTVNSTASGGLSEADVNALVNANTNVVLKNGTNTFTGPNRFGAGIQVANAGGGYAVMSSNGTLQLGATNNTYNLETYDLYVNDSSQFNGNVYASYISAGGVNALSLGAAATLGAATSLAITTPSASVSGTLTASALVASNSTSVFKSPTNNPTGDYVLTASDTNGTSRWAVAPSATGAPLDGTNTFTGPNAFRAGIDVRNGGGGYAAMSSNGTLQLGATNNIYNLATYDLYVDGAAQFNAEIFPSTAGGIAFGATYGRINAPNPGEIRLAPAKVLTVSTNVIVSGSLTASAYATATNSWSLNTPLPYGTNSLLLVSGAATGGITALANFPSAASATVKLFITATGDLELTNVIGIATSDFVDSRTITNGNTAKIEVENAGSITNMTITQYRSR